MDFFGTDTQQFWCQRLAQGRSDMQTPGVASQWTTTAPPEPDACLIITSGSKTNPAVRVKAVTCALLDSSSPWWASAEGDEAGREGGRWRSEGRSAHSSLGCNWISTACSGRMLSPRSPCRGVLARLASNLPDSFKVSSANRLLALLELSSTWPNVYVHVCGCLTAAGVVFVTGLMVYDACIRWRTLMSSHLCGTDGE